MVDVPSFMVRLDSQKLIEFATTSPYGGGRPGRVARRSARNAASKAAGGSSNNNNDEDDE